MTPPGTGDADAPPETRRSNQGQEFEVVRRAGPVEFQGAPYVRAEAREELLVLKNGPFFLCARPDGDVWPGQASGEGFYFSDTRFLSELRVTVGGKQAVLLSASAESRYGALVDATNPELGGDGAPATSQQNLYIKRFVLVYEGLYVRLVVRNFGPMAIRSEIGITLGADFADMFEVRGHRRRLARGHSLAPKQEGQSVTLAYLGQDEQLRETVIRIDQDPATTELNEDKVALGWPLDLEPRGEIQLVLEIEPRTDGRRRRRVSIDAAADDAERRQHEWRSSCTRIESDNELFGRIVDASLRDIHALLTPSPRSGEESVVAAGIPWFVALFGRDSLLTSYGTCVLTPDLARQNLIALARFQAADDDAWRDAEPGKILHELRCGELAQANLIPHTPYYGSVDSTPLFLLLASAYHRWTNDIETMAELRPSLDAALRWIDTYGDRDGDGFVEYERRSPGGLQNQGWKDSEDCIVHADGKLAESPIALVEVQGYVYLAKLRIADVYAALGAVEQAAKLRAEANVLKTTFNDAFWSDEEGTFALALDARKRQVLSVTSNPGHCLYCDIVDPAKADALAQRLLADDMFCGWGIRTLSSESPAFNPMSYHNGSVWPHDNAIAAAGLKRYGFHRGMMRIADALFDVASTSRDARLPELYCGFVRDPISIAPVAYPVACSPQAWASAAPILVLQAMLGISADAPSDALYVHQPRLPDWLRLVELRGLTVADSRVSLAFRRDGDVTTFSLIEQEGPVQVTMLG
jgi:glycogen debranching enzyme